MSQIFRVLRSETFHFFHHDGGGGDAGEIEREVVHVISSNDGDAITKTLEEYHKHFLFFKSLVCLRD